MKNMTVRAVADSAMGAALCALLMLIALYVPVIAAVAAFVSGVPLMYLCCKHGSVSGGLAFVCGFLMVFILTGNILSAGIMALSYTLPALAFGICASKKTKFSAAIIAMAVVSLLGSMIELVMINGGGSGIENMLSSYASQMQTAFGEALAVSGIELNGEMSGILNEAVAQVTDLVMLYLPSIIIAAAAFSAYLTASVGAYILKRVGVKDVPYVRLNQLHATKPMCYCAGIIGIISLMAGSEGLYGAALNNLFLMSELAIAVCGFAFVDNKFSSALKSGYIRALIYVGAGFAFITMLPFALNIFVLIGFFDGLFWHPRNGRQGGDRSENQ